MKRVNFYKDFDFKKAKFLIRLALKEDIGRGDITSELTVPSGKMSNAEILAKEDGIIAGLKIFKQVFEILDKKVKVDFYASDGGKIRKNQVLGVVKGNARSMLAGERTALNILQRMSGIATMTNNFIHKLNNRKIQIIDTRKTTPNFRLFEKLAVRIGGGSNHRNGLFDMVLIKDNHIEASGGIENVLEKLRRSRFRSGKKVEIEVKNFIELQTVCKKGKGLVDRIMLDNFSDSDLKKLNSVYSGGMEIEISGGVNEKNISKYGKIKNIDYISIGRLTHSVRSLDIALNFIT